MKKILLLFFSIIFFSGCSTTLAGDAVETYLMKFKNHEEEVLKSLDELISYENLSLKQQEQYRLVMKRQYQDLTYKTVQEYYNGDKAIITEEIEVYDYNKSKRETKEYYEEHQSTLTKGQYQEMQLKAMATEQKRIKYTIDFELNYQEDGWHLTNLDYTILQKIHGIYES